MKSEACFTTYSREEKTGMDLAAIVHATLRRQFRQRQSLTDHNAPHSTYLEIALSAVQDAIR